MIYFNDLNFKNTKTYNDFINKNKGNGYLNIRSYAASKAIPISGLNVIVYKLLNNEKVIFFEGKTDSSGVIDNIVLPSPLISNIDEPLSESYEIEAKYENQKLVFKVLIYTDIQVNQNINVVPEIRLDGKSYGG